MIRALHRKVRRLAKACMADRPAHEILAFMLHGLAATADEAGREIVRERLRRLRAGRGPQADIETPPARGPDPDLTTEPALPPPAGPFPAPARKPSEPPLMILDPSDPKNDWMHVINKPPNGPRPQVPDPPEQEPVEPELPAYLQWQLVINKPPPGPRPPPPPPYRDPLDDPLGLYGEPTEWKDPFA